MPLMRRTTIDSALFESAGQNKSQDIKQCFSNLSYDLFFLTFTGTPLSQPYSGPLIDSVSLLRSLRSLRARLSDEAAARSTAVDTVLSENTVTFDLKQLTTSQSSLVGAILIYYKH